MRLLNKLVVFVTFNLESKYNIFPLKFYVDNKILHVYVTRAL